MVIKEHSKKTVKLFVVVKSVDGGTGIFILNLLKLQNLYKDKFSIRVVVLERPKYRTLPQRRYISYVHNSSLPSHYSLFSLIWISFFKEMIWLYGDIGKTKPDIVISVDLHAGLLAELVRCAGKRYKHVLTLHNNVTDTLREKASVFLRFCLRHVYSIVLKRATVVTSLSVGLAKAIEKEFRLVEKIYPIYGGEQIGKGQTFKMKPKDSKIIVTVGRLVPQKDMKTLIKAFSSVNEKIKKSRLWIVGDGQNKEDLLHFASKITPNNTVKFWGWQKNPRSFMRKADVFVLSSLREGFSYVVLEALSCGIPVVATNSPYGPAEVLDNGTYGKLVPVGDYRAMASAILSVLKKKATPLVRNVYIKRSREFSDKKMMMLYKELLLNVNSLKE